jgi:spermidine synthase
MLKILVFFSGYTVLGLEMCASRLLQPYFGESLLIWANIIGFVMFYLAIGYFFGGKLADKRPSHSLLLNLVAWAGFAIGLIPLVSDPILKIANEGFLTASGGLFLGSLFGMLILFAVPLILLGMVSPFVVRLSLTNTANVGQTAGQIFFISTIGSLVGTFLPVLVLIPLIGTRPTIYTLAIGLVGLVWGVKIGGAWVFHPHPNPLPSREREQKNALDPLRVLPEGERGQDDRPNPSRVSPSNSLRGRGQDDRPNPSRVSPSNSLRGRGQNDRPTPSRVSPSMGRRQTLRVLPVLMLVIILVLAVTVNTRVIRPVVDGVLVYEQESAYHYIQVVQRGDNTYLMLNEGLALHSVYNPKQLLTGATWDFFMLAPFFNQNFRENDLKSMLMIGLGAGTVPKQVTQAFGTAVRIDGVEIDPAIIEVGRKYFAMNEPNLNAIAQDGRYFLLTSAKKYDIIGMDAYRQPYIPFHLTTKEFFQLTKAHLTPQGTVVVNAGSPEIGGKMDYRLAHQLATNLKAVFPSVFLVDVAGYYSTIIYATNQPTTLEHFRNNILDNVSSDVIKLAGEKALVEGNIREWTIVGKVFTDDWSPVEQLIDQIIIDYAIRRQ